MSGYHDRRLARRLEDPEFRAEYDIQTRTFWPSRERLHDAISPAWESSTVLADRAGVNTRAAGQMLAGLWRGSAVVERRQCVDTGRWEYRRVTA